MKKLIMVMIAALTAITGYSATDAELKAMLDAKDYAKFVASTTRNQQVTNLVSSADAQGVCEAALSTTNKNWMSISLCKAKKIDLKTIYDIAIAKQNPYAFEIAVETQNDELIVLTWEKSLDFPKKPINRIFNYFNKNENFKIKNDNLSLAKKTAEIMLTEKNIHYTAFVFGRAKSANAEYKEWATSCIKNVNKETCDLSGWMRLMFFDGSLLKTDAYYFENMWKRTNLGRNKILYKLLHKTPYYDKAVNTIEKSIKDPESAYVFATRVDFYAKNKEMTKKLYPVISKDIHFACKAAFYLNDTDKVIDIMLNAGEELTAKELDKMIPMINSLSVDYRATEIITALRNINSRYTLRLYNERETWEPILSKIRAMIDIRQ